MNLKDRNARQRSTQEIAAAIRQKLPPMPGVLVRTRAGGSGMFMRMGNQSEDRLSVEVRGFDLRDASELAAQVKTTMETVPGVVDAQVSRREGMPEMLVHVDRDKASLMGMSVSQLANTLRTAVGGTRASMFREGGDEFNIQVRLQALDRNNLNQVNQVPISGPLGRTIPVSSIVKTERVEGPVTIERRDQERVITVNANIANRDMGSVANDMSERFKSLRMPKDFYILFGGELEEQAKAFRELLFSLILAIVLVYAVMAAQFESFRDPLIIMFSIPLAGIGVALALFLTNTNFNMQAFIGVILLAGIVVNNAIVLIDYINLLRREYGHSLREAIEIGGRRRLRPILMTTLTAILGLIPMALGIGEGAEVQSPMARVVIGGLASSTLITLIFIPVLYYIVEHWHERKLQPSDDAPVPSA